MSWRFIETLYLSAFVQDLEPALTAGAHARAKHTVPFEYSGVGSLAQVPYGSPRIWLGPYAFSRAVTSEALPASRATRRGL